MCGIYFSTRPGTIHAMRDALLHRGPDAQAVKLFDNGIALGHNRLAIVDTRGNAGDQPYYGPGYVCCFNGEIFNYKELQDPSAIHRSEVQVLGDLMKADHDLSQILNGYYAVIFYDTSRERVVLARDFYGVMPLYCTTKWGYLEVASEPHALLRDGEQPILMSDVQTIPANSKTVYDLRTGWLHTSYYSSLYRITSKAPPAPRFVDAVARTITHSDNGFSVALSGGLDSSLVLAAAHWLGAVPEAIITTYTQDDGDEVERAKELVTQFGLLSRWKAVPVEQFDVRSRLPVPNPIRDFAFQRHATVASHSPTKVILCGEGADELGLGYSVNKEMNTPVDRYLKKVSLLKSQATMTLDRVNMAGMMFSKEFRVPFLDLEFSLACLASDQTNKSLFRKFARTLGVPMSIIEASKYGAEEAIGRNQ